MSEIKMRVDATHGALVRAGAKVIKNQIIGQKADGSGKPFYCPVKGRVKKVDFDGEDHEFIIIISAD